MIGDDDDDQDEFIADLQIGDNNWSLDEDDAEIGDRFIPWMEALQLNYSGDQDSFIQVNITVEEPEYISVTFYPSEEDWREVQEKMRNKVEAIQG